MQPTLPAWLSRPIEALRMAGPRLVGGAPSTASRLEPGFDAPALPRLSSRSANLRLVGASAGSPCRPLRLRVDPRDGQRTSISGRMSEVCDALDALVLKQANG